ncbi:MAG: dihydrofolate reductase [Firmicutes bacterium]|nr:dihydrofolate reductase [Bacillota bacterium]
MKMIVAADKKGGIGKNGDLLVSIPTDMKYFREQTMGKTIVMGRATLESFPGAKPLPKRRNIVLSTKLQPAEGIEICRSVDEVLELLKDENPDSIMIVGGGTVYKAFMPYCSHALITEIDETFDADTFIDLPAESDEWELESRQPDITENGVTYAFAVYRRIG